MFCRQSLILAVLGVIDLASTLWLVYRHDAAEANPLMARVLACGPTAFIIVKLGVLGGSLAVLEWARRRRPRTVLRAMNVAIAAYLGLYMLGVSHANSVPDPSNMIGTDASQRRLWARIEARMRAHGWPRRHVASIGKVPRLATAPARAGREAVMATDPVPLAPNRVTTGPRAPFRRADVPVLKPRLARPMALAPEDAAPS